MKTEPRISVIIPVWNAADRISATLDALRAQTAPEDSFEVLVVDNGSTDRTGEIARTYPFATVLEDPQPGSYRARNRAPSGAKIGLYGCCLPLLAVAKLEMLAPALGKSPYSS